MIQKYLPKVTFVLITKTIVTACLFFFFQVTDDDLREKQEILEQLMMWSLIHYPKSTKCDSLLNNCQQYLNEILLTTLTRTNNNGDDEDGWDYGDEEDFDFRFTGGTKMNNRLDHLRMESMMLSPISEHTDTFSNDDVLIASPPPILPSSSNRDDIYDATEGDDHLQDETIYDVDGFHLPPNTGTLASAPPILSPLPPHLYDETEGVDHLQDGNVDGSKMYPKEIILASLHDDVFDPKNIDHLQEKEIDQHSMLLPGKLDNSVFEWRR